MCTSNGDERLNVVLIQYCCKLRGEWNRPLKHTSTQFGPPPPCSGDSTHLKLG